MPLGPRVHKIISLCSPQMEIIPRSSISNTTLETYILSWTHELPQSVISKPEYATVDLL